MHDFFDIVGLSRSAPPVEVRRACARLIRRTHPDFGHPGAEARLPALEQSLGTASPVRRDVAVDFLEIATVLDRMQSAFFRDGHRRTF
ncbi:MAG: hypothetical protein IT183_01095 [Acidobacteria bacterium]|nr:hypothetical protein [Acidobacteriota bacterium]